MAIFSLHKELITIIAPHKGRLNLFKIHILQQRWPLHNEDHMKILHRILVKWPVWTYIFSRWSWYFNPCFREEGTWTKHESNVDNCMKRVFKDVAKGLWWRHVVAQTPNWVRGSARTSWTSVSPNTQKTNEEVTLELHCQHLERIIYYFMAPQKFSFIHIWISTYDTYVKLKCVHIMMSIYKHRCWGQLI